MRSLRSEDGLSLVELLVASAVAAVLLLILANFVVSNLNAGAFTDGQSATINDARNALQKVEKEVRGADSISWCAPVGSCLEVGAQSVLGGFRTVRYTYDASALQRAEYDAGTSTWGPPENVIERVANTPSQPVFSCDTASTLLRVTVDLHIRPTPNSTPVYSVQTSIRPRNFPSKAACP